MSPLGGQASLRLLRSGELSESSSQKLRYMSTGPAATSLSMTAIGLGSLETDHLYTAALLAPNYNHSGKQDIWGHVKIPHLGTLEASEADAEGWTNAFNSNISAVEDYVALVGIPVVDRPNLERQISPWKHLTWILSVGRFKG